MSPEEGIEHGRLVGDDIQRLRGHACISRDVRAAKDHARDASREQLENASENLFISRDIVSCPVSTVLLTTDVEAPRQNKLTSCEIVASHGSSVC